MKKVLALVLSFLMLMGCVSAVAEDQIQLGQVQFAAHGAQAFAVITVAVQGETIVSALIDEFQVMSGEGVVGVPNSDQAFGGNIVGNEDGKVLGSKRVNNAYYSGNMASRGGATQELAASWDGIQAFVAGKTISELDQMIFPKESAEVTDIVTSSTLTDTKGYILGILAAARVAAGIQTGHYTVYNETGETVTELYIAHNETGDKGENLVGEGLANGENLLVTKSIPASADGHGALTFTFVTESGYTGEFTTLSIEDAPMTLLAPDALTGATPLTFFAPTK